MYASQKNISDSPQSANAQVRQENIFFQPKLSVNQPNDEYEQEADAVADKVMRMPANNPSFFSPSTNYISYIQRKCKACEEEEKKLHRKETNSNEAALNSSTENYIGSLTGKGKSLSKEERNFFESRMGYDFSNVQIHTNQEANRSAKDINALAYTHGNNIVFGDNQYQPDTDSGKRLIAHELTHVVQQNSIIKRKKNPIVTVAIEKDYSQEIISFARGFGYKNIMILSGKTLDLYDVEHNIALGGFSINIDEYKVRQLTSQYYFIDFPVLSFDSKLMNIGYITGFVLTADMPDISPAQINDEYFNTKNWFDNNVDKNAFADLVSGKNFYLMVAPQTSVLDNTADKGPSPRKWMESLQKNIKTLIEETKLKEPASIDLPDKNVQLFYDKKESKWKLRAYQKAKGKNAMHFVFVDLKENDTKEKLLEKTRQAIRNEIANDNKNTITVDGQKQSFNPKYNRAYDWMQRLRQAIAADRHKTRGEVYNLPDAVSLSASSAEENTLFVTVSVFVDDRMSIDDLSKIEKDIEKMRIYSDDVFYTPPYGGGITMKSGTIPKPVLVESDPQQFLDFYIRPYTEALRNRYSDKKINKDDNHKYTRILKAYPAYIRPLNVRPDFQSVTGAEQAFHMVIDITATEGTSNIAASVFFNPIYYKWRVYNLNDVLPPDDLAKFSSDWEIKRTQLSALFKDRATIKTKPLVKEKETIAQKIVDATFPHIIESKPIYYGDSGLDPDTKFTLPGIAGDYLVYCSAQTEPFGNTIQIPSEAFFPIRLRNGYELANETLTKYRNPEVVKLEALLDKTKDVVKQNKIKQRINDIYSTALRDTTDENNPDSKIGDANERISIAQKLLTLYKTWNKENDKSISDDLDFRLILSGDKQDGQALLDLWTLDIKRKAGYVTDNISKYIEGQTASIKGIKELHSRIIEFDDDIDYKMPVYTPNLVLISDETGQEYQLISMLGYEKNSAAEKLYGIHYGRVVLVDVSTSDTQKIYHSDTLLNKETATEQEFINAAKEAFKDLAGTCKYGEGYIAYEVPGLTNLHGLISGECSTGQKFLNVLGKLAMVAGIAALVLGTVATGGALGVAVTALGVASGVIGAALAAKNISDRISNHRFKVDVEFALDVINIVGPLAMGAGALSRAAKIGMLDRGIADIAQLSKLQGLVKLESGIALYQKIETGTNFILTNYKMLDDLNKINNMHIPDEQKDVLRRELLMNGIIGNMMFATSVAHGYNGETSVNDEINAKIMSIDINAYKEANIKSGIYTPEGTFNGNFAKEHNLTETSPEKTNVDENTTVVDPETNNTNNDPKINTESSPKDTNKPHSSHDVDNTATHQNHEHQIAENGAITRCSEHCLPLTLDINKRAKDIRNVFDGNHPNNKKATQLAKAAKKLAKESEKVAKITDEAERKTKEDNIYAKAEEIERSMAQLESDMVTALKSRSAKNVADIKNLIETNPEQKKPFEKKLNDLAAQLKEATENSFDTDPEKSKEAWEDLINIDKKIRDLKKSISWEIDNLSKPDISERYMYEEYMTRNGSKVKSVKGELGVPGKVRQVRDEPSQSKVSKGSGDDAGHLIANIFGGAGDNRNLSKQNWVLNEYGNWKELENYWSDKLKNGTKITVEIMDVTMPNEDRPYMRRAKWTEVDAEGNTTHYELDFNNTHTPESRDAQQISPTPDVPSEGGNLIDMNKEKEKRNLPQYYGEE